MTGDSSHQEMARTVGIWFRRKISVLGGEVFRALVTTVSLSIGFMFFNDRIAPPPDLSGRWTFTVTYERTDLRRFENLEVTFQALLIQEGLRLSGTGEKVSERSPGKDQINYTGKDRKNIQIVGSIKRNYFSDDELVLHYTEEGEHRESSTVHRLVLLGQETMRGRFWSTIANTSGSVGWQYGDSRSQNSAKASIENRSGA